MSCIGCANLAKQERSLAQSQQIEEPCGLTGTEEERIANCASSREGFMLLLRTQDNVQIFRQNESGLLWSNLIEQPLVNFKDAVKTCEQYLKNKGLFENLKWRLPTSDEYISAVKSGAELALPFFGGESKTYWTSDKLPAFNYYYAGYKVAYRPQLNDTLLINKYTFKSSVRCVSVLN